MYIVILLACSGLIDEIIYYLFSFRMDLALSMTMRLFLFETPFCCGLYAT